MSYNTDHLRTAGKITVYTTLLGVAIFAVIFGLNIGERHIKEADAQSQATTTVTVLNTAPVWTATTTEVIESSATNPTNAGDTVSWTAIGTDSNAEDYWLLICSTNASPTPNSSAPPVCSSGIQWARSGTTTSGVAAVASTTTLDAWSESNAWYGWICDSNAGTPRCNSTYTQGTNATNSSPFEVNHRPAFTSFVDDSPANPGQAVIFSSVSSDSDASGVADTVFLTVCASSGFNTTTNTCTGTTLATSTALVSANATATYTIVIPTQDQNYGAYGYVTDNHGFEATTTQGSDSTLTVNNVAPTVSSSTISVNGGSDIILTTESGETTGFTLSFTTSDNNSCDAAGGGAGDEVIDYALSLYRTPTGNSSTTCTTASGSYDPNDCYPSELATTTWNLTCTPNTGTCSGSNDSDMTWSCTFPLWYIADPTGSTTAAYFQTDEWRAQVQGVDDDSATGTLTESATGVDVQPLLAFALNTLTIPYGALEPGQQNDPLVATTTLAATGNVGLDKDVEGESMCTTYSQATPCAPSSTSTIPESEQRFATGTVSYAAATPLSSTTPQEVEINVKKTVATSTQQTASAYWGIRVPGTITYAGSYTGQNTFTAIVGEPAQWY